ncbi:CHAT domain-containing protein [Haliangium sp.]|uniref:CHAT domain-containing protein n=1 Tax=Haliangium sp. TaxID=2663208 RepID=UPI003D1369C9
MSKEAWSLIFEFARTDTPEDPYAFRFGRQDYSLRTTHGGRKRVQLDWSDALLNDLDALHEPYCDPAVAQRVGRTLCSFLEPSGWSWHAQELSAAVQESGPVIVTIRSAAAELYALPWELLPLEATGQCVGELPGVLVRYEWPETHTVPAKLIPDARGGRILMAWSNAAGPVPAAEHISGISTACELSAQEFVADRDVVAHATVGRLADALERGSSEGRPAAVLHLLCHGGRAGRTWGLMLDGEGPDDEAVAVDAWRLRQLLAPHAATLRLVVVSACGSAYGREFDSIPQALHRAGIEAVVASRFPLSVPGSIRLAETLYEAMLVQHRTLEDAFLEVRKHLARDAARLDWAGLQLYARLADGHASHPLEAGRPRGSQAEQAPPELSRVDLVGLDLPELLELRGQVSSTLSSRFESQQALLCIELADVAFRAGPADPELQKRCYGLLAEASLPHHGRIFATQGESLRACYPGVKDALRTVFGFIEALTEYNYRASRENQLVVCMGLHYGPVLSNGKLVTGVAVELAARIASAAGQSEVLLSQNALNQAPRVTQAVCQPVSTIKHADLDMAIELYRLPWTGDQHLPSVVEIEESGEEMSLPKQDIIAFGRLDSLADGTRANDIVLTHPDEESQLSISRWHFEVRRTMEGYVLRAVSGQSTEVDGRLVAQGEEVPVNAGSVVRLAQVMTLRFRGAERRSSVRDAVTVQHGS